MTQGDTILRAFALIQSLRSNVPEGYEVEQRWVDEFNAAVELLVNATGQNLELFKVQTSDLYQSVGSRNYLTGDVSYRDGLWCKREMLVHKIDALLTYFTGLHTGQDRKIGFRTT